MSTRHELFIYKYCIIRTKLLHRYLKKTYAYTANFQMLLSQTLAPSRIIWIRVHCLPHLGSPNLNNTQDLIITTPHTIQFQTWRGFSLYQGFAPNVYQRTKDKFSLKVYKYKMYWIYTWICWLSSSISSVFS